MILQETYERAQQATVVAEAWYRELFQAFATGQLQLHTNYGGLQLVSIFDAKPHAWRARPVFAVKFDMPDIEPPKPFVVPPTLNDELPQKYHEALAAEKNAWDASNVAFVDHVMNHPEKGRCNVDLGFVRYNAGKLRVLEVKPYGK